MRKFLLFFLFYSQLLFAQREKKSLFPTSVAGIQYAGSIGWLSVSYFRQSANKKIEAGLLFGYTPESLGGEIYTIALKFIYEPFRVNIKPDFQIEPLQAGIFVTQNFANNLQLAWSDRYDKGYYWWTNSMRFHIFLGSQASYVIDAKVVQKISLYFETNTNDLYISSYISNNNRNSLDLDDIFFFGIGSKVYFK